MVDGTPGASLSAVGKTSVFLRGDPPQKEGALNAVGIEVFEATKITEARAGIGLLTCVVTDGPVEAWVWGQRSVFGLGRKLGGFCVV